MEINGQYCQVLSKGTKFVILIIRIDLISKLFIHNSMILCSVRDIRYEVSYEPNNRFVTCQTKSLRLLTDRSVMCRIAVSVM